MWTVVSYSGLDLLLPRKEWWTQQRKNLYYIFFSLKFVMGYPSSIESSGPIFQDSMIAMHSHQIHWPDNLDWFIHCLIMPQVKSCRHNKNLLGKVPNKGQVISKLFSDIPDFQAWFLVFVCCNILLIFLPYFWQIITNGNSLKVHKKIFECFQVQSVWNSHTREGARKPLQKNSIFPWRLF